jgi:hypothetical protein
VGLHKCLTTIDTDHRLMGEGPGGRALCTNTS